MSRANFRRVVLDPSKTVLMEFYAPWCSYCRELEPEMEALARALKSDPEVVVARADVTVQKALGKQFGIEGLPTLKAFSKRDKSGKVKYLGQKTAEAMEEYVRLAKEEKHFDAPAYVEPEPDANAGDDREGGDDSDGWMSYDNIDVDIDPDNDQL